MLITMGQIGWISALGKQHAAMKDWEGHLQGSWEDFQDRCFKGKKQDAEHGLRSATNSTM